MDTLGQLFGYFFTHKDFLPPAHELDGTLFTPLHLAVSAILLAIIILAAIRLRHLGERGVRTCLFVLWVSVTVLEVIKTLWETFAGASVHFEIWGNLPLYPCSIFMYAMPLAIFGKGIVRKMGCGYVCTLGTLGAAVNFFYPVNVIGRYSCISFAGAQTLLFHGTMLFCALLMLLSGYHSYRDARRPLDLLLPAVPALAVSVIANTVNFTLDTDYMFFRLRSFFFAPLGEALPPFVSVLLVYLLYLIIHAAPYLPFYLKNRRRAKESQ